jgi:phenylalanyl-tRNA synthetase alpha subunit
MSSRSPADQTLNELGISTPLQIANLFKEIGSQLTTHHLRGDLDESRWREARDHWLGRKSGVLSKITDNWLKPAPLELKKVVGQELNKLKTYVEATLEEKRKQLESAAEQSAAAREEIDFSLPGI